MTERKFVEKWSRRAVTFPLFMLWFWLTVALAPLLAIVAVTVDLFRRRQWAAVRSLAFMYLYTFAECGAIWFCFFIWIGSGACLGFGKARMIRWTKVVQRWYGAAAFYGTSWLFDLNFEVEGLDEIEHGPAILFFRHVSMPDTSLPGALFVLRKGWHVRHIAKRELLWDPTLDIIGNRLPNFFVRRGMADNTAEIAGMRRVGRDLEDEEAVVIFPEGTRFTPEKRLATIKRMAEKGQTYLAEKTKALTHVLPPRLGGSLALLEENTRACAVFAAHVGFEQAARALHVLNGSLVRRTIRVKLWKIPFDQIPTTRELRIEWLYEQWQRIDEWVAAHLEPAVVA